MSTSKSLAVSPTGASHFTFDTVRVSGSRQTILHLFKSGGREAACKWIGPDTYEGWLVGYRERTVTIKGAAHTREAVSHFVRELALMAYDVPIQKKFIRLTRPVLRAATFYCKPVTEEQAAKTWHISPKNVKKLWKQVTVNRIALEVHKRGYVTDEEIFLLKNMEPPIPAPAPISIKNEVDKIIDALISTRVEQRSLNQFWPRGKGYFNWASRIYRLKEMEEGNLYVLDGGKEPRAHIGHIVYRTVMGNGKEVAVPANRKTWRQHDDAREKVTAFVKALYPDLPEKVEVQREEIPF